MVAHVPASSGCVRILDVTEVVIAQRCSPATTSQVVNQAHSHVQVLYKPIVCFFLVAFPRATYCLSFPRRIPTCKYCTNLLFVLSSSHSHVQVLYKPIVCPFLVAFPRASIVQTYCLSFPRRIPTCKYCINLLFVLSSSHSHVQVLYKPIVCPFLVAFPRASIVQTYCLSFPRRIPTCKYCTNLLFVLSSSHSHVQVLYKPIVCFFLVAFPCATIV